MFSMHGVFQGMQNIKGLNTQIINSVTLAIPITNLRVKSFRRPSQ